jgi:2-methylcitrate dehydratase PrpD
LGANTIDITAAKAISLFAASLSWESIPDRTQLTVKRIILDCIGTALAATTLGEGCRETIAVACRLGGAKESTILGVGVKVSAIHAAFANGALVHALNYDPIGAEIGHIGVACLPAPLALAEATGGMSGRELIAAATVACEVCASDGSNQPNGTAAKREILVGPAPQSLRRRRRRWTHAWIERRCDGKCSRAGIDADEWFPADRAVR